MPKKRKTFREYLLEGGVGGRYFVRRGYTPMFHTQGVIVYQVTDIEKSGLVYIRYACGSECCNNLNSCLGDKESTKKQIETFRAKESRLAKN